MIQLLRVNSEANPILEAGQLGYDTYRHAIKIGDGSTNFNNLPSTAADPDIYTSKGIKWVGDFLGISVQYMANETFMELKARNLTIEGGAEGYTDGQLNINNVSSIYFNNMNNIYFKPYPSIHDDSASRITCSVDSGLYMYGYQGSEILRSVAAGNTFYGNLIGTADNSLLFDDMTSDDVYHTNNKPTKADVGLGNVQNQYNYGHVELSGNQLGAGYLTLGNCRILCQRWATVDVSSFSGYSSGDIYVGHVAVDLAFYYNFKSVPNLLIFSFVVFTKYK